MLKNENKLEKHPYHSIFTSGSTEVLPAPILQTQLKTKNVLLDLAGKDKAKVLARGSIMRVLTVSKEC